MARTTVVPLPLLALLLALSVEAQDHAHHGEAVAVGRVTFPSSCAPAAQASFERGVAMLHSFWFEAAEAAFREAASADPRCPMPHWGIAMTLLGNPFTGVSPSPPALTAALAAARGSASLALDATAREQRYTHAAVALFDGHETADHRTRLGRHEAAMRAAHEADPDDAEAAIFLARAMIANAPLADMGYVRQLEAAAILEPLFAAHPEHPGLAHYIIHAFDAPPIAHHGLDAARRYAAIAPAAPHALHMPSHIFTRLGHWDDSIETNRRSAAAEPDSNAAVHPMDYLVYAYLQQGRDAEASDVVARAVQNPDRFYGGIVGYNFAAMAARLALERGRWEDAAALRIPPAGPAFVRAVTHFARAVGAARHGDPRAARADAAALAALRDTLTAAADPYWPTVVDAQRLAAEAWIARAEGDRAGALLLGLRAAELEESVEKHPVTPGPLLPARELYADLLMDAGRAEEALAAYRATLRREPNRARTLYGAARAAEAAGDAAAAAGYYRGLLAVMARADASRPEPAIARAYLNGR